MSKPIRRRAATLVLIGALVAPAAVSASTSGATGGSATGGSATGGSAAVPPRAQLVGFRCVRAINPANREIALSAVMRPLSGTVRMQMRFDLFERPFGSTTDQIVRVGDLGTWRSPSNPTLGQQPGDVWQLLKRVYNLDVPATYRLRVTFRWTGAHSHVIGTATRYSKPCREPERRPDLLVRSIVVQPVAGKPSVNLYVATIADQGATGAGPFEVLFNPGDGSAPTTRTIRWLGAHQSRVLTFHGPVCNSASPPTVTADATGVVDDSNTANNELAAVCP